MSDAPAYPHILIISDGEKEHEFQLTGGPLDHALGHQAVMAGVGRCLLAWARMEQHLNMLILTVNREEYSPSLYETDRPEALKWKLKLLKRWFNRHPPLAHRRDEFRRLSAAVAKLATIRNTLAHGILEAVDTKSGVATFRAVQWRKTGSFSLNFSQA